MVDASDWISLVTFEKIPGVEASQLFYHPRTILKSGKILKFRYPQGRGLELLSE